MGNLSSLALLPGDYDAYAQQIMINQGVVPPPHINNTICFYIFLYFKDSKTVFINIVEIYTSNYDSCRKQSNYKTDQSIKTGQSMKTDQSVRLFGQIPQLVMAKIFYL